MQPECTRTSTSSSGLMMTELMSELVEMPSEPCPGEVKEAA